MAKAQGTKEQGALMKLEEVRVGRAWRRRGE